MAAQVLGHGLKMAVYSNTFKVFKKLSTFIKT